MEKIRYTVVNYGINHTLLVYICILYSRKYWRSLNNILVQNKILAKFKFGGGTSQHHHKHCAHAYQEVLPSSVKVLGQSCEFEYLQEI